MGLFEEFVFHRLCELGAFVGDEGAECGGEGAGGLGLVGWVAFCLVQVEAVGLGVGLDGRGGYEGEAVGALGSVFVNDLFCGFVRVVVDIASDAVPLECSDALPGVVSSYYM